MKKDKVTFAMTPVSAVQVGKKRGKSKAVAIVLSITAAVPGADQAVYLCG